ncbi:MAG: cytochrome b/b6 domain-containing protein [Roseitalea porphyridii]|uniref:cytochrome b/b6 domain-containing protein n=1 Tax=Roseitalea porphyridii TaxID=1852022 RepID=UPI0032D9884C
MLQKTPVRDDRSKAPETVRIWDLFVRLFHWSLTLSFAGAWLLGAFGPAVMTWHFYLGYCVLALIAGRFVWGFAGPAPARFRSYFYRPGVVIAYLRHVMDRTPSYWPGHNPVGGVYVLLLLIVVAALAITGLLADPEDYINVGPLAQYVSIETSRQAIVWHDRLADLALAMVTFHIAAIAFYHLWKREDLLRPMVTGWKKVVLRSPTGTAWDDSDRPVEPGRETQ